MGDAGEIYDNAFNIPLAYNIRAIDMLRRNNREDTTISLRLVAFTRKVAQECAVALLQNTSAKTLHLEDYGHFSAPPSFPTMKSEDWISFWKATRSSASLEKID